MATEERQQQVDRLFQLAVSSERAKVWDLAEQRYRSVLELDSSHHEALNNLGVVLYSVGKYSEAIESIDEALRLDPLVARYHYNLGKTLEELGKLAQAMTSYHKAIEIDVDFHIAKTDLAKLLTIQGESLYRKLILAQPKNASAYLKLNKLLHGSGKIEKAIAVAEEGCTALPENLALQVSKYFTLPILYKSQKEIGIYNQRFEAGIANLKSRLRLDTLEEKRTALNSICSQLNFYLGYQGLNVRNLQEQYGELLSKCMAANFPQWVKPLSMPSLTNNQKIRVGYISTHFWNHTVGKLTVGWLKHHDRNDFEVYCYYLGNEVDAIYKEFSCYSDIFYHLNCDIEDICNQIVSDRLHILVFTDIGMDPITKQISGLRLAPVQCTSWCHPISSGLATIDYFISSELMEPKNAQEHYSETLITIPNIGISYSKPEFPEETKSRSYFLPDLIDRNRIVYLSCQSLFKYLPQYDYIFPEIACQVPQALFVFIAGSSSGVTDIFMNRMREAFSKYNINSANFCRILPTLARKDYLSLNLASDIFLDTFSWSGGNTTLEAIACDLPVVTCPGEFMRGRHSFGILKMLGVTDTIANTEAEYVQIAVRLGVDPIWRTEIIKQMQERHSLLYDDTECIAGLESFYRQVVRERLNS